MSQRDEKLEYFAALTPVETKRASEVIFDQILELIASGQLKPGDRLPSERSLMEMLKRSRPTVREALRMLESAGYIRTVPGSNGAVVQKPSTRNVEQSLEHLFRTKHISPTEMLEYREVNDIMMVRWAAERHTQEDIAAMDKLLQTAESLLNNYPEFIKLDPVFHALIAKAAKNEVAQIISFVLGSTITSTIRNRMNQLTEQGRADMCTGVLRMHRRLADAIATGDANEAERAMRFHLHALEEDLLSPVE